MSRFTMLLLLTFATVSNRLAAFDRPVGYERVTTLTVDSNVFKELTPLEVYTEFAVPLPAFGFALPQKEKRLIDIEPHVNAAGHLRLSGVWIENKGAFKHDTWLLLDLSEDDIGTIRANWGRLAVPLDIERYEIDGERRFALLLQSNLHEGHWKVLHDVSEDSIRFEESEGFRPVDIDEYVDYSSQDAEFGFDAVMVKNEGANHVTYAWTKIPTYNQIVIEKLPFTLSKFQHLAFQATDVEVLSVNYNGILNGRAILVASDRSFYIGTGQTWEETWAAQPFYGRVVDLEGGPSATSEPSDFLPDNEFQTIMAGNPAGQ